MGKCKWALANAKMEQYHDEVWGVPEYRDQQLFRKLMLDINQAGLSWNTILQKMENFDAAYDDFEIAKVATFNEEKIEELILDAGIIRNRRKIEAAVNNAQKVLLLQEEFGSFSEYLWEFVGGKPLDHQIQTESEIPTNNEISDRLSKDLKKRGFKFVGSTIIYAFMQAVGMVNDHLVDCPCHEVVKKQKNDPDY